MGMMHVIRINKGIDIWLEIGEVGEMIRNTTCTYILPGTGELWERVEGQTHSVRYAGKWGQ